MLEVCFTVAKIGESGTELKRFVRAYLLAMLAGIEVMSIRSCLMVAVVLVTQAAAIQRPGMCKCGRCKRLLPSSEFHSPVGTVSGVSSYCKACTSSATMKVVERHLHYETLTHKCCSRCGSDLPRSEFYRSVVAATGLHSSCKSCLSAARREGMARRGR